VRIPATDRAAGAVLAAMEILPSRSQQTAAMGNCVIISKRQGTPIGPNDMLIAAHALAVGLAVVTDNAREFSRVPGLNVTNWLAP